jgi:hypothetical protein
MRDTLSAVVSQPEEPINFSNSRRIVACPVKATWDVDETIRMTPYYHTPNTLATGKNSACLMPQFRSRDGRSTAILAVRMGKMPMRNSRHGQDAHATAIEPDVPGANERVATPPNVASPTIPGPVAAPLTCIVVLR